jgi:hypothetical protein
VHRPEVNGWAKGSLIRICDYSAERREACSNQAFAASLRCISRPRFAFFNDAGFGVDRAGAACLPILDSERIAAATVAADSACIGDGQSTLTQGIISAVNDAAYRLGARVGETALDVARTVAERA